MSLPPLQQSDIFALVIMPYFKSKNPLQLNCVFQEEALVFTLIALTCKAWKAFTQPYLKMLKEHYKGNLNSFRPYSSLKEGICVKLHLCIVAGNMEQFLARLRIGEDVNQRDRRGRTAHQLAKRLKRFEYIALIEAHPKFRA
ncbi:MAG: ankyrin repeat domain-containing protein [Simkania negevensis]|nr:ankyrin repeat domain-containing protein [Simkania negevensis]